MRYLENLTIDNKFINKWFQLFIHQVICLTHVEKKKLLAHHNKVVERLLNYHFLKNGEAATEQLLQEMCSWNWAKLKIIHKEFQLYIKKQTFSRSISETSENVCFYFRNGFPRRMYYNISFSLVWWELNFKH